MRSLLVAVGGFCGLVRRNIQRITGQCIGYDLLRLLPGSEERLRALDLDCTEFVRVETEKL
jgi:hypothetical protein